MGNVWKAMQKREAEAEKTSTSPGASEKRPAPPKPEDAVPEAPRPEPSPVAKAVAEPPAPKAPAESGPASASSITSNGYAPELIAHHDRGGPIAEEYRGIRTNLLARAPNQRFCYVVTSALGSEGKTVTCLNLAMVMAERQDFRTLVVDCDLRKGRIATLLRASNTPGMAEVLRGEAGAAEAVQPTAYPNLFVAPSGRAKADQVGELVTRPELEEAIAGFRKTYDYVIVDTPPVTVVSETCMIGQAVGSALLVVRMGKTHRESVETALRLLGAANVDVEGVVLTHRRHRSRQYAYKYYY